MAQDVLAVLATSVGVKHLFNMAHDVCNYQRGHLSLETIRKIMLVKHVDQKHLCVEEEVDFNMLKEQQDCLSDLSLLAYKALNSNNDSNSGESDNTTSGHALAYTEDSDESLPSLPSQGIPATVTNLHQKVTHVSVCGISQLWAGKQS